MGDAPEARGKEQPVYNLDADPANWREGDLERDAERAAKIMAWVEEARDELESIVGEGEAGEGQIKVTTTADGLVRDVVVTRRAMRLDSRTLAEQLLLAVGRAQDDAERRGRAMLDEALGEVLPPGTLDLGVVEEEQGRLLRLFERP
ncbi:YbaB/EbfC family DNA-binding protein [Sphaerisporangium album]|uniref:YbaB/EbfC family DNA-binding protein n=1 Tax=Sphaerisporangium album TaxID=509200 RepID=A0A367FL86_9ACTN|nr:YbaB/EbfC family nucleoid-associated protein [Sphaerisporangium album]RCG31021.1 YbaB/EbfC family DNA-binding protein [Sphaerisporangium album]